jgi:hypothetical protein
MALSSGASIKWPVACGLLCSLVVTKGPKGHSGPQLEFRERCGRYRAAGDTSGRVHRRRSLLA